MAAKNAMVIYQVSYTDTGTLDSSAVSYLDCSTPKAFLEERNYFSRPAIRAHKASHRVS